MGRALPREITLRLRKPHAAQARILRERRRFNVLACGRRFGKTTLGLDVLVQPALEGYPVGWFAPTYKTLAELWREARRTLKPITSSANATERRIELHTGGVFEFWSLEDPEACRGRKYKSIAIDEAAKVRKLKDAWTLAIRATLADYQGEAWFLSTPKGKDYFHELWLRGQRLATGAPLDGGEDWPNWASWRMPTASNPLIVPGEIEEMRRDLPRETFEQEVLAKFLEEAGRFFSTWNADKHTWTPIDIRSQWNWTFFGAFDWGYASPFCFLLFAIDQRGIVYVIDEEYGTKQEDDEQAKLVVSCLARWGLKPHDVTIYADPAMWAATRERRGPGKPRVEEFWGAGLRFVKADNRRIDGWSNARMYLSQEKLRVFKGKCPNLVRTITEMVHDAKNVEDLDSDLEDHAVDTLRYGLMSRPISRNTTEALAAVQRAEQQARDEFLGTDDGDYL